MRLHRAFAFATITVIAVAPFNSRAHAESVQDTQVIPYTLAEPGDEIGRPGQCWATMTPGTQVTVTYNVRATNANTGEPVCGTSVPVGTPLRFEFMPHVSEDIAWSATGYYAGTPYGSWAVNGNYSQWNSGTKNRCVSPNWYQMVVNAHGGYVQLYADLAIATPAKDISVNGTGLDCPAADGNGNHLCTAEQAGTTDVEFNIRSTSGFFYPGQVQTGTPTRPSQVQHCDAGFVSPMQRAGAEITNAEQTIVWGGCYSNSAYNVVVKEKTISCPITVLALDPENPNTPPTTPTLAAGGACVVGQPHSISMQSTDPGNDNLRYGVDWDSDGSIDQYIPPTWYVASGSTQTASRTYSVAGSKTVRVFAQDEGGLTSSWATLSFTCATAGIDENDNQNNNQNNNNNTGTPSAVLDLRVIPSLVRNGNATKVNWSGSNVTSCTVRGENGDAWSRVSSPVGGQTSSPITGQVTYTLACIDSGGVTITRTATVRTVPTWRERQLISCDASLKPIQKRRT